MKGTQQLLGLLLAVVLVSQGYSSQGLPRKRAHWARADTDTVRQKIAVINGESLFGNVEGGTRVQVVRNVTGTQDSTQLSAGWAKRYIETGRLLLIQDVVVIDRGDTLWADTVHYNEPDKVARASGSVRLSDGDIVVHAPEGEYFIDEKRAVFHLGLELVDSAATVTGSTGIYWTEEKRAEIGGHVRYESEDTWLETDSLTYLREETVSIARGNVAMERIVKEGNSVVRTQLFGDWARIREEAGTSELRGRPLMIQFRQDSSSVDTLAMQADVITTLDTDTLRRMTALGGVRYWAQDLAAIADSMFFVERKASDSSAVSIDSSNVGTGVIYLYGAPFLWTEGAQVTGDSMRVALTDQQVDSLLVRGEAFVAHEDTVLKRINQVRGLTLVAWFGEEDRRTFKVTPNAEIVYYLRDDDDGPDGAYQGSGDEAILELIGDEPIGISLVRGVQATLHPESVLEMPLELDGLRWYPDRRPRVEQFFANKRYVDWMRRKAGS